MSGVATFHNPKQIIASSAVYTTTLIAQKVFSFAYFSLIARALGPDRLGTYVFALSFASFFSLVVDFGFVQMAIRTFSQKTEKQERLFNTFFTIRVAFAIIGVVILFVTAALLGYENELLTLIAITSLIMVMDAFTSFFYTVFRARQNLFYESLGTIVFQVIIFSAGVYALSQTRDLRILLLVIGLGSLWHVIYAIIMIRRRARYRFNIITDWITIKQWIVASLPFFFTAGFIKAYNTIDSILLKNLEGDEAVGFYAIAAKVVFTFPFIALAITASVYPAMSNYMVTSKEKLQKIFERTLQLLLTLSMPIAVGIFLLADPIVVRIWPEFRASVPALKALIWAVVFLYVEYPFGSLLNATGNERRNTVNRGIQLGVFVILNLLLIPRYGFMGAAYAALFCSALIVALGWLKARAIVDVVTKKTLVSFLKISLSAYAMGEFVLWARDSLSFLVIIPIAAALYGVLLAALKVYTIEDWKWIQSLISRKKTM